MAPGARTEAAAIAALESWLAQAVEAGVDLIQIRERDLHLQGTVNPMVADHGQDSEARQYSGRQVGPGWAAPFPIDEKEHQ